MHFLARSALNISTSTIRPAIATVRIPARYLAVASWQTPNPIQASFLRGGTSKGIFLLRSRLPLERDKWDKIFLGIMGSPDPRQWNGMGGGISSLSKVCVVGPPS